MTIITVQKAHQEFQFETSSQTCSHGQLSLSLWDPKGMRVKHKHCAHMQQLIVDWWPEGF